MTGMKSGAGDDPFADVSDDANDDANDEYGDDTDDTDTEINRTRSDAGRTDEQEDDQQPPVGSETAGKKTPSERTRTDTSERTRTDTSERTRTDTSERTRTDSSERTRTDSSERAPVSVDDLPYIARRNVRGESVKTGRDKNVLFELRPEIADREDEFVAELERRLGTDVPKTDAREAALAAIWEHPDLVVPILEQWGLGYFDD